MGPFSSKTNYFASLDTQDLMVTKVTASKTSTDNNNGLSSFFNFRHERKNVSRVDNNEINKCHFHILTWSATCNAVLCPTCGWLAGCLGQFFPAHNHKNDKYVTMRMMRVIDEWH